MLTSGILPLDKMLDGLGPGKIALVEGDAAASRLSHLLAVRAQLPKGKGGLASTVVWLDDGNSFSVYGIAELSRRLGLSSERAPGGSTSRGPSPATRCRPWWPRGSGPR